MLDDLRNYISPASDSGDLVVHLQDADTITVIERLRETRAAEMRRAFILDLGGMRERMGEKWPRKRDLIYDLLKDAFEKQFTEPDWCVRLTEDLFLLVPVTIGEHAGAETIAGLWRSVEDHFIGVTGDVAPLFWVSIVDNSVLFLHALDVKAYFDRSDSRPAAYQASRSPGGQAEPSAEGHLPKPIYWQIPETNYRVRCAPEPLFEMRKLLMIGHRFEPVVLFGTGETPVDSRHISGLEWGLRERLDIANLEGGINALRMRTAAQRRLVMVVPAAFSTFANPRARARIVSEVSAACQELSMRCIFEIRDIEGVPPGRMTEIMSLLRPYSMTCIGHVRDNPKSITVLKDCGLGGICVGFNPENGDDHALESRLSALSVAARGTTGACMVEGFSTVHQLAIAKLAGVSHASLRAEHSATVH